MPSRSPIDIPSGGKRRNRWRIVLGAALGILISIVLVVSLALYAERRLIAASFVQQYLQAYGIESDIEFDQLAWGGFLARVRAGPLDAPDFTADGVDVTLIYPDTSSLVGRVTPQVAAVRLVRPVMRVTYDGEKLSFGSLQPLIDDILMSESDVPGPEIAIGDGNLLLATPNGTVNLFADASIDKNKLNRLNATVRRSMLKGKNFAADLIAGTVTANMAGDVLNASATLTLNSLTYEGRTLRGIQAASEVRGIKWRDDDGSYSFTIPDGTITANITAADTPELATGASRLRIGLSAIEGALRDGELSVKGKGDVGGEFASVKAADATLVSLKAQSALSSFNAHASQASWSGDAAARIVLDASGARYQALGGAISLASLRAELDSTGKITAEGPSATVRGTLTTSGTLPRAVALRSFRADFDGSVDAGTSRIGLTSIVARSTIPRATAMEWARSVPGLGGDEATANAIAGALQSIALTVRNVVVDSSAEETRVTARTPIVFDGADRARLTLTPRDARPLARMRGEVLAGGFNLDVRGDTVPQLRLQVPTYNYRSTGGRTNLDAQTEFSTALSYASLRGIELTGAGRLQMANERTRFDLPGCTELRLASYTSNGADLIRNLNGRVCGSALQMTGNRTSLELSTCADVNIDSLLNSGGALARDARGRLCRIENRPVFVMERADWQLDGRLRDATARILSADTLISEGAGRVQLSGDAGAVGTGTINIDQLRVADLQTSPRFQPISAAGAMAVKNDDWQGNLTVSSGNRRLASVALKHSLASGAGGAEIEARGLAFDPNMLQPADLAPFLSTFGSRVRGNADFTGRIAWTKDRLTSDGRLVLSGVDVQSRFGPVRQLKTDLAFTSLMPFALRPDQAVTMDRLDLFVPLEQVSARFTYTPESFRLESATASVAEGKVTLDPMTYTFATGRTTEGTIRLQNVNVTPLIAAAGLGDRMSVTSRVDGVVPFTFGPEGLRFANGRVAANGPGRMSIKREALTGAVGTGGGAQAPPNAVQDFAYQALENLAFERLEGVVDSMPMGRLGLTLHVVGRNDPAQVAETRVGVVDLLRGRAFDKPLPLPKGTPIDLTLDTSLNLDELLASYLNQSGGTGDPATNSAGR